jgi:hypothetical protein
VNLRASRADSADPGVLDAENYVNRDIKLAFE